MNYLPPFPSLRKKLQVTKEQLKGNDPIPVPAAALKELLQTALMQCDFDEQNYLDSNEDVKSAVEAGRLPSGFAHFVAYGYFEGRRGGVPLDERWYLISNPDVRKAVADGVVPSAAEHFHLTGAAEGRSPSRRAQADARKWKVALNP